MAVVREAAAAGFSVLTAHSRERARELMAKAAPDLIVADCALEASPLIWVEEACRAGLAAQVIAVTDQPDFKNAMDWVAGGVFAVLEKPLEAKRLRRMIGAALEHCDAFRRLVAAGETLPTDPRRPDELTSFYQGLIGQIDGRALKQYIVDSVKSLTKAGRVELNLAEGLENAEYGLDAPSDEAGPEEAGRADKAGPEGRPANCRLGFELRLDQRRLGEMYLYYEAENRLTPKEHPAMAEIAAAVSAALGAVWEYNKAVNMASRDGLTGLYNRRVFNDALKREFAKARRHHHNLSILSLDLDHFKNVNDRFGHQTGDRVLQAVARIIARVSRLTDIPARIGGEEFAVIMPHATEEQAYCLAERLKKILAESDFDLSGVIFRQTVSQGVAGLEHFMVKTPEDMVYWADQALYQAKREGRDAIRAASGLPVTPAMKDGSYAFQ
jgi:diguanylate cyclase (GGDEF)-like protein